MPWSLNDVASQQGKTFLVTGSNAGLGFSAVRQLAQKNATLVMACRNAGKGQRALDAIKKTVPAADVHLLLLDLASLESVRQFAGAFLSRYQRLDVLINNAGVMMPPFGRTADGFETQFGTNVLGHFALTGLLLPLIDRTPEARVVWLGSIAHWFGRIDFDNLAAERGYRRWTAYSQSKLANIMLAYELQRRLQRSGSATLSVAAHPGGTNTDLSRHNRLLQMASRFAQSVDDGALPSIRAAVAPDVRGGDYYGPAGLATASGPPVKQRSSRRSHDETTARRLWEVCEELTGVTYLSQ